MVVAVSSTADARLGAPSRPALTAGESVRTPRPWAAPLAKPATRILVAGGLTLAGWLLGGALSGSTASAAETATCQHATASSVTSSSTVEHGAAAHGHHRKSHRESGAATCAQQPTTGDEATQAEQPAETPATETPSTGKKTEQAHETSAVEKLTAAVSTKDTQATEEPAGSQTTTTKATSSGGDLLGGLVSSVLKVVGGTLTTVTHTVGAVTDTLSHTVLAPLTQPPADHPDAPVLLPLDDILGPVLNGGSNSGGVTVTLPDDVTAAVTQAATSAGAVTETAPAAATPQSTRVAVVHLIERQHTLPATPEQQPRDSGVHARNGGGDSGPGGLPGGTTAPSAPATSAVPGHDGPGGARQQFAVHTDDATTTQLKLIGTSRDHEVDGAGREAALPTTSPD